MANEAIPSGTNIQINLQVDPNYPTNLIKFTNYTNANHSPAVVKLSASAANNIGVGITDLAIYMRRAWNDEPLGIERVIRLKQFFSQIINLTGKSGKYEVSIPTPKVLTHVLMCFLNPPVSGTGINGNPTDFGAGFTNDCLTADANTLDAVNCLSQIQMQYNGRLYPNNTYSPMNLNTAVSSSTGDAIRAYFDFLNNCKAKSITNCGSLYTFE